jgi:general secretion pathway protein A
MYNDHYGFSENPFDLSPDPKFLFPAVSHYETLALMLDSIQNRKGITVISGEVGIGKTTLIHVLLKDLSEKIKTAFIFHPRMKFQDLLRSILLDLGVSIYDDNLSSLLVTFIKYLRERKDEDETVAILIDEAQTMQIDVLEDLLRLYSREAPTAKHVQILLVGQTELDAILASPRLLEFKDKISMHGRITPLTHKECEDYIDHRLKVVGSSAAKVFDPEATSLIGNFSGGIPRVINLVCDRALLSGYTASKNKIDAAIAKETIEEMSHLRAQPEIRIPREKFPKALIAIGILVGIVVAVLLFQIFQKEKPKREIAVKEEEKAAPVEAKIVPQEKQEKVVPKQKPPEKPSLKVISVQQGWTLLSVVQQFYGATNPTLIGLLLEFNPEITNLNRIYVNQKIKIPAITEQMFVRSIPGDGYKILLGTFTSERSIDPLRNDPTLKKKKLELVPRRVSPQDVWLDAWAGEYGAREDALRAIQALRQKDLLPAFSGSSK